MPPKEKAKQLVDYFTNTMLGADMYGDYDEATKKCVLIAVDEIIKSREEDNRHFDDTLSSIGSEYYTPHPMYLTYWLQVKQEIEKL